MLGVNDSIELELPRWEEIASRATLPEGEFLDREGLLPIKPDSRRSFQRMYMREPAVAGDGEPLHAIYLSDVSRSGIGFYSPVQLLPLARLAIWTPGGRKLQIVVRNCVRIQEACYRCGAEFQAGESTPDVGETRR